MSLRTRVVVLIAVVVLFSVLLGTAVAGLQARRTLHDELTAALAGGGQTIGRAYEDLGRSGATERGLRQLVATFDGSRHLRVRLVDAGGRSLAVSAAPTRTAPAPGWFAAMLGPGPAAESLPAPGGAEAIELQPLAAPDVAALWGEALRALVILVGTAVLGLVLVYFAMGAALRPLRRMSSGLERIGAGDYAAEVAEEGPPELVGLQRAYNGMARQLAAMQRRNRLLEAQVATIQDEERAEIARDLHDEMGPYLVAVTIDAQIIGSLVDGAPVAPKVRERLKGMQEAVAHMQRLVRDLIGRLRPTPVTELGLAPALDDLVEFWRARRPEVSVAVELMNEAALSEPVKEAAYRIMQEGLSNAIRHASPSTVQVWVRPSGPNAVEVGVADDGQGKPAPSAGGFGLLGLRERAQALGGEVKVENGGAGRGWTVRARLPLTPEATATETVA